ncbi:hypothetical protein MAJ_07468, partial [Metarhizium majus ARSEF 297]
MVMVRITAITLLAFASSVLATPMPQAATDPQGQMIDFQGNPLPSDKQAQVIQLQKQGTQAYRELEATYSPEQEKKNEEVKDIIQAKEEDKQAQQAQKAKPGQQGQQAPPA